MSPEDLVQRRMVAVLIPASVIVKEGFGPRQREEFVRGDRADDAIRQHDEADTRIRTCIDTLDRQLDELAPQCAPHLEAINQAATAVRNADRDHHDARTELAEAGRLHRRGARHHVQDAAGELAAAKSTLDAVTAQARPTLDLRNALVNERDSLDNNVTINRRYLRDLNRLDEKLEIARHTIDALDIWHDWAKGHQLAPQALVQAAIDLHDHGGHHAALPDPSPTGVARRASRENQRSRISER